MEWVKVTDRLPCVVGEQAKVLFCSPGWGWAVIGMFTNFRGSVVWSDQQNDRYIEWDGESPTLWMPKPEVPNV